MTTHRSSSAIADDPVGGQQEHPLAESGKEAGETAGHLAERATGIGFQQADRAREQTAEGLNQLADSARRVSTDMESEQPMIANVTMTAAEQTERIAGYLRETDARQLINSVEDVARKQPLLFVGGAFLLGVAASRFLKAGSGGNARNQGSGGRGYESTYPAYEPAYEATARGGIAGEPMTDPTAEGLRP